MADAAAARRRSIAEVMPENTKQQTKPTYSYI